MIWFKKLLGHLGFSYCRQCGAKLIFKYKHGYDELEVWECPTHGRNW